MLKKITLTVIWIHVAGICFLLFSPVKISKLPPQKFIVQTHTFKQVSKQPYRATTQATKTAQTPTPKPPKKKPVPQKKPPQKKPIPAQKHPQEKKPEIKPPPDTRKPSPKPAIDLQKQIVQELEEIVAKIEEKEEKIIPPSSLQETGSSLQNTSAIFALAPEERYQESLLAYLQEALHLPEQGEVKIQLSIKEDGNLAKIVVLKAESVKNREYLEKQLPLLRFPYLHELRVREKVFVLTFCNEPKN